MHINKTYQKLAKRAIGNKKHNLHLWWSSPATCTGDVFECQLANLCIRQHGSAVYVGMVVVVCIP